MFYCFIVYSLVVFVVFCCFVVLLLIRLARFRSCRAQPLRIAAREGGKTDFSALVEAGFPLKECPWEHPVRSNLVIRTGCIGRTRREALLPNATQNSPQQAAPAAPQGLEILEPWFQRRCRRLPETSRRGTKRSVLQCLLHLMPVSNSTSCGLGTCASLGVRLPQPGAAKRGEMRSDAAAQGHLTPCDATRGHAL